MPSSVWKYIENQFEVATRESFKKMHAILVDHLANLEASALPAVTALVARTLAMFTAWKDAFNAWKTKTATYADSTRALMIQLESLTRQVGEEATVLGGWENKIAGKYPPGSSKYKAIFPHGRSGVTEGTLDERVAALVQLGEQVAAAGGLDTVAADIAAFADATETLRETQQGNEGHANAARLALEPLRLEASRVLYGNLGVLMDIYQQNPAAIAGFFELTLLRDTGGGSAPEEPGAPTPPAGPATP